MPTPDRERDVGHFDRWSHTCERSWMQRVLFDPAHREALKLAAEFIPQPGTVLDVGCGTGRLVRDAQGIWPGARFIGVDPALGMIEVAQHMTPGATFIVGMGEALPLSDASVDLALSTVSFHHWGDQEAGVRDIARVLRPGGHFVLVDMSFPGWVIHTLRLTRVHGRAGMRTLFARAGLRVRRQRKVAWRGWLATVGEK